MREMRRKGVGMITIILMVIAVILFLGIMGDNDKLNKRTYCFGFIACVVAVVAIEVADKLI